MTNGSGKKHHEWVGIKWQQPLLWILAAALIAVSFAVFKFGFSPVAKPSVLHAYLTSDKGTDVTPDIAFGGGQWVVTWSSDDDLKGGTRADSEILFSRSANGLNWSKPARLIAVPELGKGNDFAPSVATDGSGTWAVAWSSLVPEIKAYNTLVQIKDDRDLLIAKSTDNGATWKDLQPLNRNADSDSPGYYSGSANKQKAEPDWDPQLSTNGNYWFVAWTGRSSAIHVKGTDCSSYMVPSRIYTQYTKDVTYVAGNPWFGPYCIGTSEHDSDPHAAADGAGNWVIAWASMGNVQNLTLGNDYDVVSTYTNESLWSVPDPAVKWSASGNVAAHATSDSATDHDDTPVLATDGKGHWLMVWSSRATTVSVGGKATSIGADADLLVAHSTDNGKTWKNVGLLNGNASSDTGQDTEPHLTTDGKGSWVAVWRSNEDLGGNIGTDNDILLSESSDNGKTWSPPRALHDNADHDSGQDGAPRIASDGTKWVVVWHSDEDGGSGTDSDIVFASGAF